MCENFDVAPTVAENAMMVYVRKNANTWSQVVRNSWHSSWLNSVEVVVDLLGKAAGERPWQS